MSCAKAWGYKPHEWWALDAAERTLLLAHARAEADPLTTSERRRAAIKQKHEAMRSTMHARRGRR